LPSFTISASSATMTANGAGAIAWTLTSVNGFAGTVGVGCGPASPPAGAILPLCDYTGGAVAQQPYTLAANGAVTGNLNLVANIPPCPCPVKLLLRPRRGGAESLALLAGTLLLGLGLRRRTARWLTPMLIAAGALIGLAGIGACGGGNTLTPGTFAYTITADQTGTNSGTFLTSNTTVNVTVPAGIATNLPSSNP
jgi:hypothetical protein